MNRKTDLPAEELNIYKNRNESQLFHYFEPEPGIFIAESPNVIERAIKGGYEPLSVLMEEKYIDNELEKLFSAHKDTPIYIGDKVLFSEIIGFDMSRGMLSAMRRKENPDYRALCKDKKRIAILNDIENPTNVGAIFRSAAALDFDCILLTKGCSDPLYRRACRVSMGTVFQVPWSYADDYFMDYLKEAGFTTVGMALSENSVSIADERLKSQDKLAVILGNESVGIAKEVLDKCDYIAKIPMSNDVDSLNVAAAGAVIFWELRK
ncbi:MAG: RNA methyltransferase [Lachnospiraceae bacterium]|nr:RNA methyltransferase [Lachnospiraceae bacterium]